MTRKEMKARILRALAEEEIVMTKPELRKIAYREAAQMLAIDMDRNDLPGDLTEDETEWVREYVKTRICPALLKRAR